MEGIVLLVSLLLRKQGFSSLSSVVEVIYPFYAKECFVLGLSFCLSRDIKSIRGTCVVFLFFFYFFIFLFFMGLGKHFSFCEKPTTHSMSTNMEEITATWRNALEQQFGIQVCAWVL